QPADAGGILSICARAGRGEEAPADGRCVRARDARTIQDLVCFYPELADQGAVLLVVALDQRLEVLRREYEGLQAALAHDARLDIGRFQRAVHLGAQPAEYVCRHAGRPEKPEPDRILEPRIEL